jgi:hypothetical protein
MFIVWSFTKFEFMVVIKNQDSHHRSFKHDETLWENE